MSSMTILIVDGSVNSTLKERKTMQKKRRIICPKCWKLRVATRHHLYPRRFFKHEKNDSVLLLCEDCHREIERILPLYTKLEKEVYIDIHKRWLAGQKLMVVIDRGRVRYETDESNTKGKVPYIRKKRGSIKNDF